MPRFAPDGAISVSRMMGGWESSRAINPSDGTDPVSLGLLPRGADPSPLTPVTFPEHPTAGPAPTPHLPEIFQDLVEESPLYPGPIPRLLNLDTQQALLNGETIPLSISDVQTIMEIVINAYERSIRDKVTSLRMEYLYEVPSSGEAVQPTDTERALVRALQGPRAQEQPEEPGQPPTPDLQSLPQAGPKRRRRLQPLPRSEAGAGATPPLP